MSKDTTGEILDYPYGQFLMLRLEFVLICDDELEAKILRIVEVWMQHEKMEWLKAAYAAIEAKQPPPPEPEDYWVTISQAQLLAQLYKFDSGKADATKHNSLSKTTLRRSLNKLIYTKNFLKTRSKPGDEFGAPQYTINRNVVQPAMKRLPEKPFAIFMNGGDSKLETPPSSKLETPTSQNAKSPVSTGESPQFPNSQVFKDIGIDSENIQEEDKERVASATSAPALSTHDKSSQQGDDDAHEPDAALPNVPALDADGLCGGVETVADPAAFQETLAQKGDTDDLSASGDADRGSARHSLHTAIAPTAQETAGLSAAAAAHTPADGRTPRLSEVDTSRRTSPQNGAVGSAPQSSGPRASGRRGKPQQQDVTQALSLQGAQVKEWMETIKGRKLRMTPKNAEACNALADEDEMSLDNLRDVIELWEKTQWVIDHNYAINVQVLAQEDGAFTFEKGMDIVRRKRKSKDPVAAGKTVSGYQYYVKPKSAKVVVV